MEFIIYLCIFMIVWLVLAVRHKIKKTDPNYVFNDDDWSETSEKIFVQFVLAILALISPIFLPIIIPFYLLWLIINKISDIISNNIKFFINRKERL